MNYSRPKYIQSQVTRECDSPHTFAERSNYVLQCSTADQLPQETHSWHRHPACGNIHTDIIELHTDTIKLFTDIIQLHRDIIKLHTDNIELMTSRIYFYMWYGDRQLLGLRSIKLTGLSKGSYQQQHYRHQSCWAYRQGFNITLSTLRKNWTIL